VRLAELRQKAGELERELKKAKEELKELVEKKRQLFDQAAELKKDMLTVSETRKEAVAKVREVKAKIDEAMSRLEEIKLRMQEYNSKIESVQSKHRVSPEALEGRINELEWRLMTEGLSAEEEAAIVETIKNLQQRLIPLREVKELRGELALLREEASKERMRIHNLIQEKRRLVAEASQWHEKYLEARERWKSVLNEALNCKKEVRTAKEKVDKIFMDLVRVNAEIVNIRSTLHVTQEKKEMFRKLAEAQRKLKIAQIAEDKLKRGQPLTWEEFRIYYEFKGSSES